MLKSIFILIIIAIVFCNGCVKEKPSVVLDKISDIKPASAIALANVTETGSTPVTERGICYNKTGNPTVNDLSAEVHENTGKGKYIGYLYSLTSDTDYYVRAYAINEEGAAYSNEISFRTKIFNMAKPCPECSTLFDYDSNSYKTVLIGEQCWMAENLRTTHYENGKLIDDYHYSTNDSLYGKYYTWKAIMGYDSSVCTNKMGVQGVCPDGWRVPTFSDWYTLVDYLGGTQQAGGKMKESGTIHWDSPNTGATNYSGFSALPGIYKKNNEDNNEYTMFWSSTSTSLNSVEIIKISYSDSSVTLTYINNTDYALPVRCIKNK